MSGKRGGGRNISARQALIIVLVFGSLLLGWLWVRQQALQVPVVAQMATLPDGSALVAYQQHFYRVGKQGEVRQGAEIPRLPQSTGLAVFGQQKVIVYIGGLQRQTFWEHLQAFFRQNRSVPQAAPEEGLYQCNWVTGQCQPFSQQYVITGAASLWWNARQKHLIVADTSQHQLLVFNGAGERVAQLGGFRYPNGIWMDDHTLYVADTNHHCIASVDAQKWQQTHCMFSTREAQRHVWPTRVVKNNDGFWVTLAQNDMRGGWLYRFNSKGESQGRRAAPLTDVVNITRLGKGLLASDYTNRSLWRLDAQGKTIQQVTLPGMEEAAANLNKWQQWSQWLLLLFINMVWAGLLFAIWDDRLLKQSVAASDTTSTNQDSKRQDAAFSSFDVLPERSNSGALATNPAIGGTLFWLVASLVWSSAFVGLQGEGVNIAFAAVIQALIALWVWEDSRHRGGKESETLWHSLAAMFIPLLAIPYYVQRLRGWSGLGKYLLKMLAGVVILWVLVAFNLTIVTLFH